jgi:2-octaprenylphenol hydroxylase
VNQNTQYDVVIVGAGMVGAATACLLARAGFSVAMVEAREPSPWSQEEPVGLRVSALSPGSADVLAEAGAWRQIIKSRTCPYRRMRVEDREVDSDIEFSSGEFGMERLGTIVENDLVQWSLWQCMQELGSIDLFCPAPVESFEYDSERVRVLLEDRTEIQAGLLVGADGADSAIRKSLGIGQQFWTYGQQGIVAVVETEIPNSGIAWQRFLQGGPLAFLPLSDGSSSIVWSQSNAEAKRLLNLDDESFCAELQVAMTGNSPTETESVGTFGAISHAGPRAAFPLTMRLSDSYTAQRAVLVGDAAHVVHPLAGQGVNLGLVDAAALIEILVNERQAGEKFSSEKSLQTYSRWRRSEAEVMARGIHGIRSLFMPEILTPLRRLGLGAVSRSWTLKEAFIRRAAGRNKNAPALTRGVGLAELLRRDR